jgi:glutathione S-transferase
MRTHSPHTPCSRRGEIIALFGSLARAESLSILARLCSRGSARTGLMPDRMRKRIARALTLTMAHLLQSKIPQLFVVAIQAAEELAAAVPFQTRGGHYSQPINSTTVKERM